VRGGREEEGRGGEGGGREGGREEATIREVDVCESINTMNLLPKEVAEVRKKNCQSSSCMQDR
jgi:hypothetical protein